MNEEEKKLHSKIIKIIKSPGKCILVTNIIIKLLKANRNEIIKYLTEKLEYAISEQKGLDEGLGAKYYLQGIESAIISIDEEFDFGINKEKK